jgi:hypothetical protein
LDRVALLAIVDGMLLLSHDSALYTSSILLRDQLVRVLLHAGLSPHFSTTTQSMWRVTFAHRHQQQPQQRTTTTTTAKRVVDRQRYAGETRVWCLQMPSGFVVVRRAVCEPLERADAYKRAPRVLQASRPTIQGSKLLSLLFFFILTNEIKTKLDCNPPLFGEHPMRVLLLIPKNPSPKLQQPEKVITQLFYVSVSHLDLFFSGRKIFMISSHCC